MVEREYIKVPKNRLVCKAFNHVILIPVSTPNGLSVKIPIANFTAVSQKIP